MQEESISLLVKLNPNVDTRSQQLLIKILSRVTRELTVKFEEGYFKHGGYLLDLDLLQETKKESLDQIIYLTGQEIKNEQQ